MTEGFGFLWATQSFNRLRSSNLSRLPSHSRRHRRAGGEQARRRVAGETRDLGGHVRLVGVAGVEREPGELAPRRPASGGEHEQALEAQDPGQDLRPVADGSVEAPAELALADPEVVADRAHAPGSLLYRRMTAAETSASGRSAPSSRRCSSPSSEW